MKRLLVPCLVGLLLLAGCQKAVEQGSPTLASRSAVAPAESAQAPRRYIALSHRLVIETADDVLQKTWEAAAAFCRAARCEIVQSSISNRPEDSNPSADLQLRVAPEDVQKLFDHLGKAGTLVQHVAESEDKTGVVVDVEARQKNMLEFRNRLRSMIGTRSGSLKDLIELERELARVQSELDSLAARRRVLANETEKVSVHVEFRARRSIAGTSFSAPIARSFRSAAYVLSESIATLITVTIAVLPWLLLGVPFLWGCVQFFRRLFRKKAPG